MSNSTTSTNNEKFIDNNTRFSIKFDNGMIFKLLIEFMSDIIGNGILYLRLNKSKINFSHRYTSGDNFPPMDVCCEIKQYCLTETLFD